MSASTIFVCLWVYESKLVCRAPSLSLHGFTVARCSPSNQWSKVFSLLHCKLFFVVVVVVVVVVVFFNLKCNYDFLIYLNSLNVFTLLILNFVHNFYPFCIIHISKFIHIFLSFYTFIHSIARRFCQTAFLSMFLIFDLVNLIKDSGPLVYKYLLSCTILSK